MDTGESYFAGLIEDQQLAGHDDDSEASAVDEVFDEDDGQFSTMTVDEEDERDIYGRDGDRPTDQLPPETRNGAANIGVEIVGMPAENENSNDDTNNDDNAANLEELPIPKGKSIAHHYIKGGRAVICSLDVEHGGEFCGLLQLSAELSRIITLPNGSLNIVKEQNTFNSYIKPPDSAIWNEQTSATHKLTANSEEIKSAKDVITVWNQFYEYINNHVDESEKVILVAYNGTTCDMKWIWKITQAPNAPCRMPPQIQFYLDPLTVMRHYKTCPLHQSKSNLESLELGMVWAYIHDNNNLNGAHDSLVDAKAQTDIIASDKFKPYIDRTVSIRTIDEIFLAREQAEMKKKMEPLRDIHTPWKELKRGDNFNWEPSRADQYDGPGGGGLCGPTSWIKDIALKETTTLAVLFLALFPISLISLIATWTRKYAYEDWVVEKEQTDGDGNVKKRKIFKRCEETTPGARRRALKEKLGKNEKVPYDITPGFVLAFIAILIIKGAHFGEKKRSRKLWREPPHGLYVPYVANSMNRNAFEFMRRYIKFGDDDNAVKEGEDGYDPLHKVSYVLKQLMQNIKKAWTAGREVTIDESMIKYKGRAISFIQYMPAKPIKHGVKVFVAACAITAIILSFEIYVGASLSTRDNSATAVVERLLDEADLLRCRGRVLYTDNWYTSMDLAKKMFTEYGWTICGTMTPTDKKSRQDHDVPFLKMSKGAVREVHRGWYREAYIELKTTTGKKYYIQCTTWRDKKQVMFLHSHLVGSSTNTTVRRHVKGSQKKVEIAAPTSQIDYVDHYNAVDRQDRDSADWTTTIKTVRYYFRIICWMLDRVIHATYVIVCYIVKLGHRPDWKKYTSTNQGREKFQIDLGILLLNHAIEIDMAAAIDGKKPRWMRQLSPLPCNCEMCYFCINGLTNGIAHVEKKRKVEIVTANHVRVKTKKCTTERVTLKPYSNYCRMCYRKKSLECPKMDSAAIKKTCKTSRMGCPQCQEPICKLCWEEGYDWHEKKGSIELSDDK